MKDPNDKDKSVWDKFLDNKKKKRTEIKKYRKEDRVFRDLDLKKIKKLKMPADQKDEASS